MGPGVEASHAYERTHQDSLLHSAHLIARYLLDDAEVKEVKSGRKKRGGLRFSHGMTVMTRRATTPDRSARTRATISRTIR